ncbi:phospholipase D4 [Hippocampus comes]|uniref:Phospholipase D family member 4 n=1 Tax=Hippocampus comes TaxID=109280 RepID=A0A3Q2Z524_HIPCM|nr:PREDICTED: phospholipase D4 [Hippocampus comes]XP_019725748.1 PREDICTED: phospholipase D4 [Hippocampus comes]
MSTTYGRMRISTNRILHDKQNKKESTCYVASIGVLATMIILGILLAVAVLEGPQASQNHVVSMDQCSMVVVESIPQHVQYKANGTFGIPLEKVWKELLSIATEELEVVSFYWTLTGNDTNITSSSDRPGREILEQLQSLPSRNVSVRVVTSLPSINSNSTDLKILAEKGVHVREVNFGRLTGGVMHSKFWIVDRRHVFIGSANMDWRALTQVKELGMVIYNCSSLARDLYKIFLSYWVMGEYNSSLPVSWPPSFDTDINKEHPLLVKKDNITSRLYIASSPPSFCPESRTRDLEAIVSIISEAQHFIDVAVMDYSPSIRFHRPKRYWPVIDNAIRAAAFERRVRIRMLISCWPYSFPGMLPFLQSLASLDSVKDHISIQIKFYILPVGNQTNIPFSRVNHNKYMVTDKAAYIGTSNWDGDYFLTTAGVGLVISQHAPHSIWKIEAVQAQLQAVFNRDWYSEFAVNFAEPGHRADCALSP